MLFVGDIFVIESLDYEATREYYLTVEATDGGSPSLRDTATVNINVTDVNDNSPRFSQTAYAAVVSEDSEPGRTVVTVSDSLPRPHACLAMLTMSTRTIMA